MTKDTTTPYVDDNTRQAQEDIQRALLRILPDTNGEWRKLTTYVRRDEHGMWMGSIHIRSSEKSKTTMPSDEELDQLYNPSISDLELDEQHGLDKPVIYLADAKKALHEAEVRGQVDVLNHLASQYQHSPNGHCAFYNDKSILKYKPCIRCILDDELATLTAEKEKR